jgi:Type IV secretion system pilin
MSILRKTEYIYRFIIIIGSLLILLTCPVVYGAQNGQNPVGSGQNPLGSGQNPGPPAQVGEVTKLANPIQADNIIEFLEQIIDVLFVFALPIIVIYIMYAGLQFVLARGNPGEIEQARNALLWAIVGGVIILGAKIIITVIAGTIQGF